MRRKQQRLLWLSISILGALAFPATSVGQSASGASASVPAITDWTSHHVIYSKPATAEQAKRVEKDPRYWQQQYRQRPTKLSATSSALAPELRLGANASLPGKKLRADWSQDLGSGATVGAGNYPAKYSFSLTTATCAGTPKPDFVVYGTGLTGSASQADIVAYDNIYSGCTGINLGTAANFAILGAATVTNSGDSVVTGANIGISPGTSLTGFPPGVLTAPAVEQLGTPVAAQAQADANTAFYYYQGLTGAAPIASVMDGLTYGPGLYSSPTLSLSAGTTVTLNGTGTYIFQIGSTLNIAGTVLLTGGATAGNVIWLVGSSATLEGTAVAAGDIVAYASITLDGGASVAGRTIALTGAITMIDNAVTTVDSVPSVYWAYNTNNGQVNTSPIFSRDGTQVAFMQKNTLGHGILVLLKWAASSTETVASPMALSRVLFAAYPTCTAPCMTTLAPEDGGGGTVGDTSSSVFYDYDNDVIYVGDDAGWLHKITPVFHGVPAEVRNGNWPVQVNPGAPSALNSPVHDYTSGNVFVTDNGGFLYQVDSTTGFVTSSSQLDFSSLDDGGPGMMEGPIVDGTAELVYAFATSDGTGACPSEADCTAIYQLQVNFLGGDLGTEVTVGNSSVEGTAPNPLYIGDFDNAYENSIYATGNLYVCGNTGGAPTLYQVPIAAGNLPPVAYSVAQLTVAADNPACSPVTDVYNPDASGGAAEWVFASVQNDGVNSGCASGGCLFNFEAAAWQPTTSYAVGQQILALSPVDHKLFTQVVIHGGTSGTTAPHWPDTGGATRTDGTVLWINQGPPSAANLAVWQAGHTFTSAGTIIDSNGNVEIVSNPPGTTGSMTPVWNTTPGGTTDDGSVIWTNAGLFGTFAYAAAGGTSGLIIDNTVGSGTLAGGSQVYFSTLSNQTCGSSTTPGGCAVQASQSDLQ
jgi:hypothetical protein